MKKIREIRFLPMDKKEEFPEFDDVLLYLLKTLPLDQEGRFTIEANILPQ